tara:strand:+ start:289 stop:1110 length:822 start_codon:yes stop_codon:yes gene_type:complete
VATVNLGRIKPVFRGAFNNSTAYVIDDIVTSGNETFIAIAATQGNATSDASKWTKLAAKGADGTDVAATLANKEIAFKTNAGALDGIPIGTAGQVLKVNSGATGYEFGADAGGTIKSMNYTVYGVQQVVGGVSNNNSKFTNLAVTVTPQSASSKFLLSATINGETHDSPWDYAFNFIRTVGGSDTDIGGLLHTTTGTAGYQAIACTPSSYAASGTNNDSTPEGASFSVVDEPNTTSAITYVPTFIANGSNFSLNRCVATGNENFVSTMYVMEF